MSQCLILNFLKVGLLLPMASVLIGRITATGPFRHIADSARDILRGKCRTAITTIFQSNALGAQHSYDCRTEDQGNIRTRLEASKIDTVSRKVWTHDGVEFTRTLHTTAELEQLILDMESHIELQQAKLETLINNVNAIETDIDRSYETKLSDIQAIVW